MMLNVTEKEFSEDEKLYLRKLHKSVYETAKLEIDRFCAICGRKVSSYCNSHSIPQFCLKNISFGKRLDSLNSIIEQPTNKFEFGIKEAGVFFSICRDCDSRVFKEYENPSNYGKDAVSHEMMREIAMKCYTREMYRHRLQYKYYSYFNDICVLPMGYDILANAESDDLSAFSKEFEDLKKDKINFRLICYEKLPYKVPLAFQDCINVISDFNGNLVNNPYLKSEKQQVLFVCVFPLEKETVILIFIGNEKKHYSGFIKQFNKLTQEDKLKSILFMMFAYSENIFISKNIQANLKDDDKIKRTARFLSLNVNTPREIAIREALLQFNLSKAFGLANYLGEKYAL